MTGQTFAIARWRALDRAGDDTCRLARADHGWLLMGHARFHDDHGWAALDYVVRCDADWRTLGADVAGLHGGQEVSLKIERCENGWRLNGLPQLELAEAADIDLSFTPATNLMPLQRLAAQQAPKLETRAAWLQYPGNGLAMLDQTYTKSSSVELVSYAARQTGFATQLCVDRCGFVTLYPGYWEGEVTHAAA